MDLKGAVAIVTGSGTGVGAALARMLAERGCNLVINYSRSETEAKMTATEIEAKGVEVLLFKGDVREDADCKAMAKAAMDKWGRIDVLVNNAGITRYTDQRDLDSINADDFLDVYHVNVVGSYQMTRACAPALKASGAGAVVNVSSIAGVNGTGSSMAYAASKGGLNIMTKSLARVLGPEIRVNAVCPGLIDSRWARNGMGEDGFASASERIAGAVPLRKISMPEDVAEVIFWLITGSSLVTGETVIIDGGMHLG